MKINKTAVLSVVVCFALCCSMLLGGTVAWFNDEASSTNNIIKSGTLDVVMEYADTADGTYADASSAKIFEYQNWEPGYTAVKYVKIKNTGSLAFKYTLQMTSDVAVTDGIELADVIDVYAVEGATVSSRAELASLNCVGTLSDILGGKVALSGTLEAQQATKPICIVLKMQESAGNEYQNLSAGNISVQLVAEQLAYEDDSLGNDYDENAGLPVATVYRTPEYENTTIPWGSFGEWSPTNPAQQLEAAYTFSAVDTAETVVNSPYKDWICDYVVYADTDIPAGMIFLGGYYETFSAWVGFENPEYVTAETQIPLLGSVVGAPWTYENIVKGVGTFICGVADINDALVGTTFTVELRLTNPTDETEYYVINSTAYTFVEDTAIDSAEELAEALAAGGEVVVAGDIDLGDTTLKVPAGVTATLNLNGYTVSQNVEIADNHSMIENNGTLIVAGNGKLSLTNTGAASEDATYASYTIRNNSTLVVENGTIECLRGEVDTASNAIFNYAGSVTINGGTISAPYSRSLRVWKGSATINGGTFDGQVWVQPMEACSLTITGGSFKPGTKGIDSSSVFVTNDVHDVTVSVTGGSFATKFGCSNANNLAGCITGGTFTDLAKANTNSVLFANA